MLDNGVDIDRQKFEIFIQNIPCLRCYKMGHNKNNCNQSQDYKICPIYSQLGHNTIENCNNTLCCINCGGEHHVLTFRCPIRRDYIKKKMKEINEKKKPEPTT